ncbi:protein kinase [Actinomadura sp. LD22]|uniref:non-specific serine/threonine protein kinase n=1 Tax=Actinomadura physcomitrii TaxID=2650748 RepID=A0A6I4MH96_9ACTN|nr:serine/threonine-protein kinase [Actinomadura physcomitrii]MWA03514.1 protein kinase [Actinomadura physcomitrii]
MEPGEVLGGRYRLVNRLGRGGMGEVWSAADQDLDRTVAIKIVLAELDGAPGLIARLRQEARVAAGLQHPGITVVHDIGEHRAGQHGYPFFVMELLDGTDFRTLLADRPNGLPVERATGLVAQVADALDYAHRKGVVHRDVKPANLMELAEGGVKICDFGICRYADATTQLTATGGTLGTPAYMAPEQYEGKQVDARADLYSLGCTLHALLTGQPPFTGSPATLMHQHLTAAPPRLSALRPDAPPELERVLTQLLAKDPRDRPATASDVAAALRGLAPVPHRPVDPAPGSPLISDSLTPAAGKPDQRPPATLTQERPQTEPTVVPTMGGGTPPTTQPPRPPHPITRRRVLIGTAATAVAAVGGGGLVLASLLRDQGQPHKPKNSEEATGPSGPIVLTGHTGLVFAVAAGQLNGRTIAVSGGEDHTVRVWDLAAGKPVGAPLTGHTRAVRAVAIGQLNGRTIAVSGGEDHTVRVWDLAAGKPVGAPLTGHTDFVRGVAIGQLDDRTIAVSGSDDHTVRIWDLAAGKQIKSLTGHTGAVSGVAIGRLDDRTIAVSGSNDNTVRIWDLAAGRQLKSLTGHTYAVSAVAIGQLSNRTVAVSGGYDDTLRVWDLAAGRQIGVSLTALNHTIDAVAIGQVDGKTVAVSNGDDHTVRVWDLVAWDQLKAPITTEPTYADPVAYPDPVAIGQLNGATIAVSADNEGAVQVWDLATGEPATFAPR